MKRHRLTEKRWRAICENDRMMDREFFYGVKSTKIFCRPSCKSKIPIRENVMIFTKIEEARESGFRPCKRCQPDGEKVPNIEWADQVKKFLEENYQKNLTLNQIADACHGSVSYLQRTFKKETGYSPSQYLAKIRMKKSEQLLIETHESMGEITAKIGLENRDHFITRFKKHMGISPLQYRKKYGKKD